MKRIVSAVVCLLAPLAAAGQSPVAGQLLVAAPALDDANFERTVVLLIHHSDEGSFGLFLNRPTWVDGGESFAALTDFDERTRTLSFGGPVGMTQLLALVTERPSAGNATEVMAGLYLTPDLATLAGEGAEDVRIFAGHAAWEPDRLQQEIDDGYWRLAAGSVELVFEVDADALYERASALADSGMTAAATGRWN